MLDSTGLVFSKIFQVTDTFIMLVATSFFLLFILFSAITIMNMLIGVLCEVVSTVARIERDESAISVLKKSILKELRDFDANGNGRIGKDELNMVMHSSTTIRALEALDVDVEVLRELHQALLNDADVSIEGIMELLLNYRGTLPCTVKHIVDAQVFTRWDLSRQMNAQWEKFKTELEGHGHKYDTLLELVRPLHGFGARPARATSNGEALGPSSHMDVRRSVNGNGASCDTPVSCNAEKYHIRYSNGKTENSQVDADSRLGARKVAYAGDKAEARYEFVHSDTAGVMMNHISLDLLDDATVKRPSETSAALVAVAERSVLVETASAAAAVTKSEAEARVAALAPATHPSMNDPIAVEALTTAAPVAEAGAREALSAHVLAAAELTAHTVATGPLEVSAHVAEAVAPTAESRSATLEPATPLASEAC